MDVAYVSHVTYVLYVAYVLRSYIRHIQHISYIHYISPHALPHPHPQGFFNFLRSVYAQISGDFVNLSPIIASHAK